MTTRDPTLAGTAAGGQQPTLTNDVTRRICADLGIRFVEGPPETRDAGGFLDQRFYLDGIHGNDEYGKLMAQEVARAMRDMGLAGG
jgi:hypothetical protein